MPDTSLAYPAARKVLHCAPLRPAANRRFSCSLLSRTLVADGMESARTPLRREQNSASTAPKTAKSHGGKVPTYLLPLQIHIGTKKSLFRREKVIRRCHPIRLNVGVQLIGSLSLVKVVADQMNIARLSSGKLQKQIRVGRRVHITKRGVCHPDQSNGGNIPLRPCGSSRETIHLQFVDILER